MKGVGCTIESVQDFLDQVGHETMYASSGNKHFSPNLFIARLTKIMNNFLEHLKIRTCKVIFMCQKAIEKIL